MERGAALILVQSRTGKSTPGRPLRREVIVGASLSVDPVWGVEAAAAQQTVACEGFGGARRSDGSAPPHASPESVAWRGV